MISMSFKKLESVHCNGVEEKFFHIQKIIENSKIQQRSKKTLKTILAS